MLLLAAPWVADLVAPAAAPRVPLPLLVRRLFFFTALPAAALGWLRLLSRGRLEDGVVVFWRRRLALPRAAALPWRLPYPLPGLGLPGFRYGLAAADPTALVAALAPERAGDGWVASARARHATRLLRNVGLKLGVVPLIPTFFLFRVQQIIAGGDILGEYRFYGLAKYLDTLLGTWIFVMAHCLIWAAVGRLVVEIVSELAPRLRWTMEVVGLLVYLGGIALGLIRIFFG